MSSGPPRAAEVEILLTVPIAEYTHADADIDIPPATAVDANSIVVADEVNEPTHPDTSLQSGRDKAAKITNKLATKSGLELELDDSKIVGYR